MNKQITLTFMREGNFFRVKELGYLCSLPLDGKVVRIENYSAGLTHSCHPNFSKTGDLKGMIKTGDLRKTDITHRQGDFIYNLSMVVCSSPLDELCHAIEQGSESMTLTDDGNYTYHFNFSKP